jgi:hypothetical protein
MEDLLVFLVWRFWMIELPLSGAVEHRRAISDLSTTVRVFDRHLPAQLCHCQAGWAIERLIAVHTLRR